MVPCQTMFQPIQKCPRRGLCAGGYCYAIEWQLKVLYKQTAAGIRHPIYPRKFMIPQRGHLSFSRSMQWLLPSREMIYTCRKNNIYIKLYTVPPEEKDTNECMLYYTDWVKCMHKLTIWLKVFSPSWDSPILRKGFVIPWRKGMLRVSSFRIISFNIKYIHIRFVITYMYVYSHM